MVVNEWWSGKLQQRSSTGCHAQRSRLLVAPCPGRNRPPSAATATRPEITDLTLPCELDVRVEEVTCAQRVITMATDQQGLRVAGAYKDADPAERAFEDADRPPPHSRRRHGTPAKQRVGHSPQTGCARRRTLCPSVTAEQTSTTYRDGHRGRLPSDPAPGGVADAPEPAWGAPDELGRLV